MVISIKETKGEVNAVNIHKSTKCLGILSYLIIDTLNQLYRIHYQFLANGNFIPAHSVTSVIHPLSK